MLNVVQYWTYLLNFVDTHEFGIVSCNALICIRGFSILTLSYISVIYSPPFCILCTRYECFDPLPLPSWCVAGCPGRGFDWGVEAPPWNIESVHRRSGGRVLCIEYMYMTRGRCTGLLYIISPIYQFRWRRVRLAICKLVIHTLK